jgi:hypothetical protein
LHSTLPIRLSQRLVTLEPELVWSRPRYRATESFFGGPYSSLPPSPCRFPDKNVLIASVALSTTLFIQNFGTLSDKWKYIARRNDWGSPKITRGQGQFSPVPQVDWAYKWRFKQPLLVHTSLMICPLRYQSVTVYVYL